MSTYYVVKKRDPGEIFGIIVTILVIVALVVVFTIYVGLIFLGILAAIAGFIGFFYSLVVYIRAGTIETKNIAHKPTDAKDLLKTWSDLTIATSKRAFSDNIVHFKNLNAKSSNMKKANPIKYLSFFLGIFVVLLGSLFILSIGIFQYLTIGFVVLFSAWAFLAMILVSSVVSLFLFLAYAFAYPFKNISLGNLFHVFNISTYQSFSGIGGEIKDYFKTYANIICCSTTDIFHSISSSASRGMSYAFYSPLRYFYLSSFIWIGLVVPIVVICFTLFAVVFFIIQLIRRVVCSLLKIILRR